MSLLHAFRIGLRQGSDDLLGVIAGLIGDVPDGDLLLLLEAERRIDVMGQGALDQIGEVPGWVAGGIDGGGLGAVGRRFGSGWSAGG